MPSALNIYEEKADFFIDLMGVIAINQLVVSRGLQCISIAVILFCQLLYQQPGV
jgi:hypothetical protein